ncbi:MAG: fimbria/pilus outer membrane usher protein [Paracoccaceae bacterium]
MSDTLDLTLKVADDIPNFQEVTPLFLSVLINGKDTGLVAEFRYHPTEKRFSATRKELGELGLKFPGGVTKRIYLDTVPGLRYTYSSADQQISLDVAHAGLEPKITSAARKPEFLPPQKGYGAVLNYTLSTELGMQGTDTNLGLNSASAALDGWLFSPFGTLGSTAFLNHNAKTGVDEIIRQETKFEFADTKHALSFTLGDFQSSSLQWSRPIRMGGFQIRRDFSLRSDIITNQRLSYSGAAALPSTVDVFIENNRAYSGPVDAGPFRLEDLPLYTGSGDAVIMVRDQNGDVTSEEVSFFASQNLLKKGLADYSLEAGFAREAFGIESNQYGSSAIASGSLRYGLTEKITLAAHGEVKSDLQLIGMGLTAVPLNLGEISGTVGASRYQGQTRGFAHGTMRTTVMGADLNLSVMRAQPGFADLALVTGAEYLGASAISGSGSLLEFPIALDVLSVAIPVTKDRRKLGLSLVHSKRSSSEDFIASASFGSNIRGSAASFGVTASHSFTNDETRASMNLSVPLGKRRTMRSGVGRDINGKVYASTSINRPLSEAVGDYGYHVQFENKDGLNFASARSDYRTRYGKASMELAQSKDSTNLRGRFSGAVAVAGPSIAFGNQVSDSFAIVDVGIPNVPVQMQNRRVTKTNNRGRALVYGLGSNRRNRISVDVNDIPPDYSLNATATEVIPARRSGNHVNLKGNGAPSALIVLRDINGDYLGAGAVVFLNNGREEFYVGYDGMAWLEDVHDFNTLEVRLSNATCHASFAYVKTGAIQDVIDPVVCK